MRRIHRTLLTVVAAAAVSIAAAACGGDTTDGAPLKIASYQGADWITDGTVQPPTTPGRGDRLRYPHTMDGAVMAAVNSQTLLDTASDATFGDIARDYFAPGDGLTAYLASRAQITVSGIDASRLPRIKGFRFTGYDAHTASVEVFFAQPDHSITGLTRHLVWIGETWLIQLPPPNTEKTLTAYAALPPDINPLPQS
ncbi:hypothetical protein ACW9HH_32710 [Nocardia gipuzkoensis]